MIRHNKKPIPDEENGFLIKDVWKLKQPSDDKQSQEPMLQVR
jgi:hypothetical protein